MTITIKKLPDNSYEFKHNESGIIKILKVGNYIKYKKNSVKNGRIVAICYKQFTLSSEITITYIDDSDQIIELKKDPELSYFIRDIDILSSFSKNMNSQRIAKLNQNTTSRLNNLSVPRQNYLDTQTGSSMSKSTKKPTVKKPATKKPTAKKPSTKK